MPRLSVLLVKTSLLYLAAGFTIGGAILWGKGFPSWAAAWNLLQAHIEILSFGWTAQLIMGTAYWILPRFAKRPARGDERLVWAAYGCLNAGILLVVFSPLADAAGWFVLAGRLAEGLGLVAFIANAWPRVKPFA